MVTPLFNFGQVCGTPGAMEALEKAGQAPSDFLDRHVRGDWGDVCQEDAEANHESLKDGSRILSAYRTTLNVKLWIITEADRSSTCILLPSEY
jgi:hypothetical protein